MSTDLTGTEMPALDPARTALVLMDFQPAIIGGLEDGAPLVERLVATTAEARAHGLTVGHVRVAFADSDYAEIPETNKSFAPLAAAKLMHADDVIANFHPALAPQEGDVVVRKVRVGGFSTTDLTEQLRKRGIDTLVLAGIHTSGVVLSTVRDGADQDFRLYVLADGTADPDPEVQSVLINKVFPRQAFVTDTAGFAELLSQI